MIDPGLAVSVIARLFHQSSISVRPSADCRSLIVLVDLAESDPHKQQLLHRDLKQLFDQVTAVRNAIRQQEIDNP